MPLVVNGETIDDAEIRAEERSIRPKLYESMRGEEGPAIEARLKQWARENLVERALLRQAAVAANPALTLEQAVQALLVKITENVARPRNKDVVEYYKKNREKLMLDEMVHASHVLKLVDAEHPEEAARAAIEEVRQQIAEGVIFEGLADFADLGFLSRGETVPPFDGVIFSLTPGTIGGPFQTQFGFHIVKVYERRPAGVPKLEEIRERISEVIYEQKRQKVIEQYLDRLRGNANVSVV